MEKSFPLDLPSPDFDDFGLLIRQESHTIDGQTKKMRMVEEMIRNRYDEEVSRVEKELRAKGVNGQDLDSEIRQMVQRIRISRLELGDGRFNLIVEKGEGSEDDQNMYRVMIPAHVDTVDSSATSDIDMDVQHPERLMGLGTYDMGAAVLNNIVLAVDTKVPVGLKVYFVFTVDEEEDSRGARELIRQWETWPLIDCVLSSEIGPVPPLPADDPRMRLFTARAGRVKFIANIDVDPGHQGHGAIADIPNAGDALRELMNRLEDRFYHGYQEQGKHEPASMKTHHLLDNEKLETGPFEAKKSREGYVPLDQARWEFSIKMVPPSTIGEYVTVIRRWAKGIAKCGEWEKYGINHTVTENSNEASYAPFEMPEDHPIVCIAKKMVEQVSGVAPEIVGAPSVADECDYAASLLSHIGNVGMPTDADAPSTFAGTDKGVITIPYRGDHAHHPNEWVSKPSIMQVRHAVRLLIENEEGFSALYRARTEIAVQKTSLSG